MIENKQVIVQGNKLIESRYTLTVGEQRLILAMVSRIEHDDADFKKYEISLRELSQLMNISLSNAYHTIDRITETLMQRVLHIPQTDGDVLKSHWVSTALHRKNSVVLSFAPELKPYLINLKREFTCLNLSVVTKFQSIYSIRLYQLLCQYRSIGHREIRLDELKEMLCLKKTQYAAIKDFKKYVLAQAKKEMEAIDKTGRPKSDLSFEVETIREGRKISRLKFIIVKNEMKEVKKAKAGNVGKSLQTIADSAIKPQPIARQFNFPEYWDEFLKYIEKEDPGLLPIIASDGPECLLVKVPYNKWSREFKR
jgi:plasmid replication initiation protein